MQGFSISSVDLHSWSLTQMQRKWPTCWRVTVGSIVRRDSRIFYLAYFIWSWQFFVRVFVNWRSLFLPVCAMTEPDGNCGSPQPDSRGHRTSRSTLSLSVVTWRGWGHSWATNKWLYLCRLFVLSNKNWCIIYLIKEFCTLIFRTITQHLGCTGVFQ